MLSIRTLIIAGVSVTISLSGEPKRALTITSPAEGTVVHPGDYVHVRVSSSGVSFTDVAIFGTDPIECRQVLKSPPYEFLVPIPPKITAGKYNLFAVGNVSHGNGEQSDPISIDVEPRNQPISINIEPSILKLKVGEQTGLRVMGRFADGSTLDLTSSTKTAYVSRDTKIATVYEDGLVTGISPGLTSILINSKARVQVEVTEGRR